ncbi:phosphotransferase [Bacillus sp. T3]|uniref:phosphotransferase n=1 Tax=Bacillus sp. T3 TaxID=467262 RepID=UPI002981125B|nr:phosphotransferase [Bacillus sp. T3]
MKARNKGDDALNNRLLSILTRSVPLKIRKIRNIRHHVFYLETDACPIILKGYSSMQRLQLQEAFAASLKAEGFRHSYKFYQFLENPIYFNKKYYGWIEYIEPHPEPFNYLTTANRKAGINLLQLFHGTTKKLAKRYERILPEFNLRDKWNERFIQFKKNQQIVQHYVSKEIINEIDDWGKISLIGMETEKYKFSDTFDPVILHGDVAHHNYLRAKTGKLYLIDYDLISIGDRSADLLQYANRILPSMNWSWAMLSQFPVLQPYLQNRAFLFALMYPSDIFREWNRIIKEGTYLMPKKLLPVVELTTRQFDLRQQFISELKNMVK